MKKVGSVKMMPVQPNNTAAQIIYPFFGPSLSPYAFMKSLVNCKV